MQNAEMQTPPLADGVVYTETIVHAPPEQFADVPRFLEGVFVVELQNNGVGFTTVHAWMRS